MAAGRHQEALQSFERAKRFAGGSDSVYLFDANIALAYLAIGQSADAMAMARASSETCRFACGQYRPEAALRLIGAAPDSVEARRKTKPT
jgi:hypothetical protein